MSSLGDTRINSLRIASQVVALAGMIAAVVAADPSLAGAQCTANGNPASCSQSGSVATTADYVIKIAMSSSTTAIAAPTATDFEAGFNSTTGPVLTVSANSSWTLSARATSSTWTHSNTGSVAARADKPAADLKWSVASNGTFAGLTQSNVSIASGSATAAAVMTLYYRTLYSWTLDTPGAYGLSVLLTLAAP